MQGGRGDLVAAAAAYAGGLTRARAAAGVQRPVPRAPVPQWTKATIIAAIKLRARSGQPLASSKAPQHFVAAARWHFGNWEAALAAAGVEPEAVRLRRAAYTKAEIIALVRRLERDGQVVRATTLKSQVKLEAVRRLFGSVGAAIRAAGAQASAAHPNQKWTRERVIEELRSRAKRGETTLTPVLHRAARKHFGGASAAREAAGVPAVLRAAWTKQALIRELRQRARRGDSGRTLGIACRRLFGSVAAARRAAGVPATQRIQGMVAWSKPRLLAELRRRVRQRLQLSRGLSDGLRRQYGSLAAARAAAGVGAARSGGNGARAVGARATRAGGGDGARAGAGGDARDGAGGDARGGAGGGARARAGGAARAGAGGDARAGAGGDARAGAGGRARAGGGGDARPPGAARRERWRQWSHAQIVEKLKEWRAAGGPLRAELRAACEHHFGSLAAASAAAKLPTRSPAWTADRIRQALRAKPKGIADPAFVAACIEYFGSVTAARADAARGQPQRRWSKAMVIRELRARASRGLKGVGRLLREPAVRLFGSAAAALQAAAG